MSSFISSWSTTQYRTGYGESPSRSARFRAASAGSLSVAASRLASSLSSFIGLFAFSFVALLGAEYLVDGVGHVVGAGDAGDSDVVGVADRTLNLVGVSGVG